MSEFEIDDTGKLKKYFDKIINRYFKDFILLKFLYVWRDKQIFEEGKIVVASVSKLSVRDRDLFGFDVRMEVDRSMWSDMPNTERFKTAFHELQHIEIEYYEIDEEEDDNLSLADPNSQSREAKVDKQDRIKFHLLEHDVSLKRFKSELSKFGLSEEEDDLRRLLNSISKKFKDKEG